MQVGILTSYPDTRKVAIETAEMQNSITIFHWIINATSVVVYKMGKLWELESKYEALVLNKLDSKFRRNVVQI